MRSRRVPRPSAAKAKRTRAGTAERYSPPTLWHLCAELFVEQVAESHHIADIAPLLYIPSALAAPLLWRGILRAIGNAARVATRLDCDIADLAQWHFRPVQPHCSINSAPSQSGARFCGVDRDAVGGWCSRIVHTYAHERHDHGDGNIDYGDDNGQRTNLMFVIELSRCAPLKQMRSSWYRPAYNSASCVRLLLERQDSHNKARVAFDSDGASDSAGEWDVPQLAWLALLGCAHTRVEDRGAPAVYTSAQVVSFVRDWFLPLLRNACSNNAAAIDHAMDEPMDYMRSVCRKRQRDNARVCAHRLDNVCSATAAYFALDANASVATHLPRVRAKHVRDYAIRHWHASPALAWCHARDLPTVWHDVPGDTTGRAPHIPTIIDYKLGGQSVPDNIVIALAAEIESVRERRSIFLEAAALQPERYAETVRGRLGRVTARHACVHFADLCDAYERGDIGRADVVAYLVGPRACPCVGDEENSDGDDVVTA